MTATLTGEDLRFINRVAARRFAGGDPVEPDASALDEAVRAGAGDSALSSSTQLLSALMTQRVFTAASEQTALLALHASLALRGLTLLAPQGVLVGMIRTLARGDHAGFERWLEDRVVPAASGE